MQVGSDNILERCKPEITVNTKEFIMKLFKGILFIFAMTAISGAALAETAVTQPEPVLAPGAQLVTSDDASEDFIILRKGEQKPVKPSPVIEEQTHTGSGVTKKVSANTLKNTKSLAKQTQQLKAKPSKQVAETQKPKVKAPNQRAEAQNGKAKAAKHVVEAQKSNAKTPNQHAQANNAKANAAKQVATAGKTKTKSPTKTPKSQVEAQKAKAKALNQVANAKKWQDIIAHQSV